MKDRDALYRKGSETHDALAKSKNGKDVEDWSSLKSFPGMDRLLNELLYGSIWSRPGLSVRDRCLATLGTLSTLQRLPQLKTLIEMSLNAGLTAAEIGEALIQNANYAGLPAAENSLALAKDIFKARGIDIPDYAVSQKDSADLEAEGRATRTRIQGAVMEQSYAGVRVLGPDFGRLVHTYIYGWVWSRPGLDFHSRFLVALGSIVPLGRTVEPAMRLLVRGMIRNGFTKEQVAEILLQVAWYVGAPSGVWALNFCLDALEDSPKA